MIVRRFMAVFADAALREATTATFDIAGHEFKATGHTTLEQGWTKFAGKYVSLEEDTLPELREGEQLLVKTIAMLAKKTQPPARFTQASLLRAMEDKELGTRATRAEILQTLYDRNYITGRTIEVTKLGEAVTAVLKEYSPRIVSEELTRRFEEEMDAVQSGGKKRDEVLEEAKAILTELLAGFKQHEPEIGEKLLAGVQQARAAEQAFGKCPNCGSDLRVIVSKATGKRFVGCSNFPKCSTSFPLPQRGALRKAGANCKCGLPMILIFGRGRRPYRACINPGCRKGSA